MNCLELKHAIESERALLQTYLESSINIDELDYKEFLTIAEDEYDKYNLICHWKDYKFLQAELKGRVEALKEELYFHTHLFMNKECPDGQIMDMGLMISAVSPFAKLVNSRIEKIKGELLEVEDV